MADAMALSKNDIDVLNHARYRTANGAFCTGDGGADYESCVKLAALGLMRFAGKYPEFGTYYVVTPDGRAFNEKEAASWPEK